MRWTTSVPLKDRVGDARTVTKFLWWPKTIGRKVRWLETVSVRQEVKKLILRGDVSYEYRWMDIIFVD